MITFDRDRIIDIVNLALLMIGAYIVIGDIFKPGILLQFDHPTHFVEMHLLVNEFIPKFGWVDGWSMSMPLGQPTLLYTYQLAGWFIAALNIVAHIDLNLSYKLLVFVAYVSTPTALYMIVSDRFGRPAGFVSSALFLFQKVHLSLLMSCLWNSYFVIGIFLIFFHILEKRWDSLTARDIAVLSLIQALVIFGHPIGHFASMMLAAIFIVIAAFSAKGYRDALYKVGCVCIIVCWGSLIAGYHLYNLVVSKSWLVPFVDPWLTKDIGSNVLLIVRTVFGGIARIASGNSLIDICGSIAINIPEALRSALGFIGIVAAIRIRREGHRTFIISLLLFGAASFFVFTGAWHLIPGLKGLAFLKMMINKRLLVYLHIVLSICAGYAVSLFLRKVKDSSVRIAMAAIGYASFFAIAVSLMIFVDQGHLAATTASEPAYRPYAALWRYLEGATGGQSRVLIQSTFENTPGDPVLDSSHLVSLGVLSGIKEIATTGIGNYFPTFKYLSTSSGQILGLSTSDWVPGEFLARCNAFNIRYVVAHEPRFQKTLADMGVFSVRERFGPVFVYERDGFRDALIEGTDVTGLRIESMSDKCVTAGGISLRQGAVCVVKVAFHPYWSASVNGRRVKMAITEYGTMKIVLPVEGDFKLGLTYNSRKMLPIVVSVTSLILCCMLMIVPVRVFRLWVGKR